MAKNVMIVTLLAMLAVLAAVHGANNLNIGTHRPGAVLVRTYVCRSHVMWFDCIHAVNFVRTNNIKFY